MNTISKLFLAVVLAAALSFAADNSTNSSSESSEKKQVSTEQTGQDNKGVAKAKIIQPVRKTNWSKIKDLFM
ncbi:MAG: hypothetical protein GF418_08425 [Chitinivibrionales bacterium]|nr:hypothetical protein [Chitinivibrionales bacterium]MBD3395638.1 hypothetical protein [Chitinivibrionales bacterium]